MTTPSAPAAGRLRPRERDAIINSLRAGVVPRAGFQHIQVGRAGEVKALAADLDRVADGGSLIRFIIGEYGAGKTFFLSLTSSIAAEKKLVTARADLTPDRRLQSTTGQARSLYAELMRNLATRAAPDGGALPAVVERFVTSARTEADASGSDVDQVISRRLSTLSEMVGGYDFAHVIGAYWRGYDAGNDQLKSDAIRWLRAEFTTKTEARAALGVRTIIDDASFYDALKLLATFVRLAGYSGLLICLDEMVNLYKLAHTQSRNSNYEQVLRIVNDCLQGRAPGLGVCFGGTPELLMDSRRGLYSYEALRSRLAENAFAVGGLVDMSSPVLRLANLTPEDLYVLLTKLRHVYAAGDPSAYLLPDDALHAFMQHCATRVGDAYFRTPRTTIREFLNLLAVVDQNPDLDWHTLIGRVELPAESNPDLQPLPEPTPSAGDDASAAALAFASPETTATLGATGSSAQDEQDDDLATFRL
ncbi:ATP-binding protein [Blastococcus sp. KM273129]|uniref:ATP-binding protein n=1 Tax=Blastococcus sp. KM273129 TaxID=2570315 RepID=UPI001F1602A6|nr:ATP-binding protein [Blastococcus sp. KM273129]MCF6733681.1 ATP-binding protein [Blastococcus sp. KM273129]